MFFAVIDCGTTNTRVYILGEDSQVIYTGKARIGVRDTALSGSAQVLKDGLSCLLKDSAGRAGLAVRDLKFAVAAGMITSELGLYELPHLKAPVSTADLALNIHHLEDKNTFPLELPLLLVPGIKNSIPDGSLHNLRKMDFMRGEETQVAGLLSIYPDLSLPLIVTILGSHTKYINVNQAREITGSITTISGQIYQALLQETIIGKSITPVENENRARRFSCREIIETASRAVVDAGLLRTLLMPRFMDVLTDTSWRDRQLFVEAAIAAEDLRALNQRRELSFSTRENFVFVGSKRRCQLFRYLLRQQAGMDTGIMLISEESAVARLAIRGAIEIARRAGYVGG